MGRRVAFICLSLGPEWGVVRLGYSGGGVGEGPLVLCASTLRRAFVPSPLPIIFPVIDSLSFCLLLLHREGDWSARSSSCTVDFSRRTHAPPRCESDFEPARRCRESNFEPARRWRRGVVARSLPEVVRRHPLCARRHQIRQGRYTTAPLLPPNFPPPEQDGQNVPAHTRAGTPAPHISAHGGPRQN